MTKNDYVSNPALTRRANQAKRLDITIKTLSLKLDELKKDIKEKMGDKEFVCDANGVILVTWNFFEREYFKSKEFKEQHADLYVQFTECRAERRFSLK